MPGHLMLAHKENGDCIYLGVGGCSIHDRKPRMCREMDCRNIARGVTYSRARKIGIVAVWRKGRQLLKEGTPT